MLFYTIKPLLLPDLFYFTSFEVGVALLLAVLYCIRVSFLPVPAICVLEVTSIDDAIDTSPNKRVWLSLLFSWL